MTLELLPALSLPFAAITADLILARGSFVLRGWAFIETTAAAGSGIDIYDGTDANGTLLAPITLSSGQSTRDWLSDSAIGVRTGLFLHVTSGSTRGALWVTPTTYIGDDVSVFGNG